MSEVKRYNPELEKDIGLGLPCLSMLGNPYGEWVRYQDYAELKAQRDALAAENGRMKKAIKRIFPEGVADEKSGIGFSDIAKECYASADETPATDAFLNSVRAEGLKMAIDHMNNQTSYDCADVTVLPVIQMYNQLRAGEPS